MIVVRGEVQLFAQEMEYELRENDHKGGWHNMSPLQLLRRLKQETGELERALREKNPSAAKVASEAADVANFAMMIADVLGGLAQGR